MSSKPLSFEIPEIVNPSGVEGSPHRRPMNYTTDETRESTVKETGGQPRIDFEGTSNPYINYESIDLLLSLQHPRSEGYDEMCFILSGQCKELLFKMVHFELHNARLCIIRDDLPRAFVILDRTKKIFRYIGDIWDVLSTITAHGFSEFRNHLGSASGQLSFMYRHVEFILGNKSKAMEQAHRNVPHVYPAIKKAFEEPSLYDEAIRMLDRKGYAIAEELLERDWTLPHQSHPSVQKAWLEIYGNPVPENELYRFGEDLTEIADLFSQYRWRHFVSVQRILGLKPGTGGSTGVGWLKGITAHRFFPELWDIRTQL